MRVREGFPNQRLVVLPANIIQRCRQLPLVSQLYVTDIGAYPTAPFHYVKREQGISQVVVIGCLSGLGEVEIEGESHRVLPGHVLLIPPNTPHIYKADPVDPWSIFWIHFGGLQIDASLQTLNVNRQRPLVFVPDIGKVKATFEDVYACLNYHYSDSGLQAMSAELLRLLSHIRLLRGRSEPRHQSADAKIVETIEFMAEHLNMPIKLKDLAAHSGHSVSYFSKLFKLRTGQSPQNYFIQLKVQKACQLLDDTDMSILEISAQLGYEDPYYFSRLFKKIQGHSPANYRKMIKG
ncbi:AraC family transcriptional regulator [Mariniblastus fucicola]|uniref:Arabinose operon regulatory protein n=1 Tax=Mariniblastus fucicola TaxID=980251 RepID=A0A5B9PE42_9BACT|nr:AraC family transcriptional regulator [Mariniblastus fucicola]QEG23410.1 Arabinose operon regulatory protein [Mariniblastus fucicola]